MVTQDYPQLAIYLPASMKSILKVITQRNAPKLAIRLTLLSVLISFPLYLHAQTVYTFTNAGATGRLGPTQSQVNTAYDSDNTLNGQITVTSTGIQKWEVPSSGEYEIEVWGAAGGYYNFSDGTRNGDGGQGVKVKAKLSLTAGDLLHILVGQNGENIENGADDTRGAGGGGGTFVYNQTQSSLLFAAGGGSGGAGGSGKNDGVNAVTTRDGRSGHARSGSTSASSGGTNGSAGSYNTYYPQRMDGGAGYSGNSTKNAYDSPNTVAYSFLKGGQGQDHGNSYYGNGGFGGGSAGNLRKGGAGGGYSGGGTVSTSTSSSDYGTGGGGGSYIITSATNVSTSDGKYDGVTTFNGASITNLGSYNSGNGKVVITLLTTPPTVTTDQLDR